MENQGSSSCSKYSPVKASEECPLLSMSVTHRQQSCRLMEESVCKTTFEPFEEKTLDSFIPKSESDFVEYAELTTRKLRSFEKNHHYVAFLKAMNELTLGDLNATDAEEVGSSLSVIAKEKRKSQEDANAGKLNINTHKKKHFHMDKLRYGSVFNRLVFGWRRKPVDVETLSENILFEILTRLPAKDVVRCRQVCRKWREVTLTPGFDARHAERAPKILIFQEDDRSLGLGSFFVFGESKKKRLIDKVERISLTFAVPKAIYGCNGLVLHTVKHDWSRISIYNPFTREELLVNVPHSIYGFFFDPDNADYRVLCGDRREGDKVVFKIYNISTKTWRTLNKTFSYTPDCDESHVMANRFLYWKVGHEGVSCGCDKFIMTFNIETEEFASRSHPEKEGCSKERHKKMHLMEGEGGKLSFTDILYDMLNVWMLEDYTGWVWERKYRIDMRWSVLEKPLSFLHENIRPVCIHGGRLLIIWDHRGVYLYHLKRRTVKEVKIDHQINHWDNSRGPSWTHSYAGFYKKSLVSLEGARRHEVRRYRYD